MLKNIIHFSREEREKYIAQIKPELSMLRVKAGISQQECANFLGVSRQTYGNIERGTQKMSWNIFLSVVFMYDYNRKTRDTLRSASSFIHDFNLKINGGEEKKDVDLNALFDGSADIFRYLDAEAMHAIKTVVMLEYARCTEMPGEAVVKAFDGVNFIFVKDPGQIKAKTTLKKVKNEQKRK